MTIYNNIFYLTGSGDQAINHKMDNLVSDNNIFFPEQDGFLDINDEKYSSLYDYQQSSGLDLNSFSINAGKDVGIYMDFYGYNVPYGGAPDIGLIELLNDHQGIASSVFDYNSNDDSPLIFPNPSNGIFKISFDYTNFQTSELQIKDVTGNLIYQDYMNADDLNQSAQMEIDITYASKGIYVVLVAIDDKVYSQRIIVN